jgi:hypothetical protein
MDFEGATLLDGGPGEIDKNNNEALTHLTDALGYYVHERHPLGGPIKAVFDNACVAAPLSASAASSTRRWRSRSSDPTGAAA